MKFFVFVFLKFRTMKQVSLRLPSSGGFPVVVPEAHKICDICCYHHKHLEITSCCGFSLCIKCEEKCGLELNCPMCRASNYPGEDESLRRLTQRIETEPDGDVKGDALLKMGLATETGRYGIVICSKAAFKFYRVAASHGNAHAQYKAGAYLYYGLSVPFNFNRALKYWKLAASQLHNEANYMCGCTYDPHVRINWECDPYDSAQCHIKTQARWDALPDHYDIAEGDYCSERNDIEGHGRAMSTALEYYTTAAAHGHEGAEAALRRLAKRGYEEAKHTIRALPTIRRFKCDCGQYFKRT